MIHFDFDWSDLLNQFLLALTVTLLAAQLWWLVFRKGFGKRPVLRAGLNLLLWLSVLCFLLQPNWLRGNAAKSALLAAENVPAAFADHLADSLGIAERIDIEDLETASIDTLLIAGQDFGPDLKTKIARLSGRPAIRWVPYYRNTEVRDLHWKGILRKGEMQVIRGRIEVRKDTELTLRYGEKHLDSLVLKPGLQDFQFKFPAFAQGRTALELLVNAQVADTLRFFARPAASLNVRFLLESPDFESRNLASWLGRNGHSVQYDAVLSRDLRADININKATAPDLIVTDPGNAKSAAVKKAVANGKSVLFMNLTNPTAELAAINAALGTRFSARKISNEETIGLSSELNALPYQFSVGGNQEQSAGYPVLVEKVSGNVGVSLLTETFPVQLAGDSTAYDKIWEAVLAVSRPTLANNIEIEAPVQTNVPVKIQLNGFKALPEQVSWGKDTVFLRSSLINAEAAEGLFIPEDAGWQSLADSMEVFAGEPTALSEMSAFVQNYQHYHPDFQGEEADGQIKGTFRKTLPDSFWFTLILACFAALWIEEKF